MIVIMGGVWDWERRRRKNNDDETKATDGLLNKIINEYLK